MAVTKSVKASAPGLGAPGQGYNSGSSSTIAANAVTVTVAVANSKTINHGKVRVKVSGIDATHALANLEVTGTDGTTTIYVVPPGGITAAANGRGLERVFEFVSDLSLNSFTVIATGALGVTAMTVDVEVVGN